MFQSSDTMDCSALKYTINQIVLLQRLKQTGLDKGQIMKGLEEIEKIEETGAPSAAVSLASLNFNASPHYDVNQCNNSNEPSANRENERPGSSSTPPSPRIPAKFPPGSVIHPLNPPNPLMFGAHLQNPNQLPLLPPVATWPTTSQAVAVATSLLQNGFAPSGVPHPMYSGLMNGRGLLRGGTGQCGAGNTVVEVDDERVDITEELEELFRRDQVAVKEDIRKFISERHISQSAIAKATKNAISQSYISQWLAQPQDISGQKKKAMYTWYLTERRKAPHGMLSSHAIAYRGSEMEQDPTNMLRTKRGARFTWPKECLAILEHFYNTNAYPGECLREKIAHSCNLIIQSQKTGLVLLDMDKVTTVKVYNWFANRRKDDKRRRHIEQVENLSMQQTQYVSSPRRNSTISPTPSCGSNESHHEEEPAIKSESHVRKDESMSIGSIAHEMEAVNRSILSLVQSHHPAAVDDEDDHEPTPYGGARPQERINHFQNISERMTECRSFAG